MKTLEGITVLDLTRFFSGPQATLLLAGLGAEVIKIDDPASGDPTAFAPPYAGPAGVSFFRQTDTDMGIAYLKRARGKQSITLNLKAERGRAIFLRMVAHADVVIDNFSAGVADRLGIGYAPLRAANPGIVYCSLTGYGATGPDRNLKAYDLMVQAAAGLMSITGQPDGMPTKAGSALSDAIAGTFAALGIVSALHHRRVTGQGQSVDVSMADALFSLLFDEPLDCYARLGMPFQQGNRIMRFSPFNTYRCSDGWVAIGTATQAEWLALLTVMQRSDLATHAAFIDMGTRVLNNAQVDELVGGFTRTLATADLLQRLQQAGVSASPVRDIGQVLDWPQLRAREMVARLHNPLADAPMDAMAAGFPIKFGGSHAGYDSPAPLPGAHTEAVLARLGGVEPAEFPALRQAGVI